MRPDRLQIVVRPRGILECLDLAAFFCGRRPLGVAAAAALGVVPCLILNRLLLAQVQEPEMVFVLGWLVLALELPWATAPLTLYLGQAVFAERISWSLAWRSFVGALPAMFLFQLILRGVCLATFVLAPVVFVGMHYLNPILLLERPAFSRVWSRRLAMSSRGTGHVLALVVVQAIVLLAGWSFGVQFIETAAAAWRGFGPDPMPGEAAVSVGRIVFPIGVELAFWIVTSFLTVFRFFAYLDTRIRREGWDVELKLRSPATYAGLRDPARNRAAVRTTVAAFLFVAVMAPAVAGPSADAAAAPAGGQARAALERQRFPWYDAQADAYRPRLPPAQNQPEQSRSRPARASGPATPSSGLGSGLMIGLAATAIAVGIFLIVRYGLPDVVPADVAKPEAAVVLATEQLAALPEATRRHEGDLLARAEALAAAGDYGTAMVFFHGWQLVQLHARGLIELGRGKTNGRYAREIADTAPEVAGFFRKSSRLFEDAFFGGLPISGEEFQAVWSGRHEITGAARPRPETHS